MGTPYIRAALSHGTCLTLLAVMCKATSDAELDPNASSLLFGSSNKTSFTASCDGLDYGRKPETIPNLRRNIVTWLSCMFTVKVAAILTCSMLLQMTQLVRTVRVFMLLTSAVVLVDLQFDLWPCLVYAIAVCAILTSFAVVGAVPHRGSPTSMTATCSRHGGCQPQSWGGQHQPRTEW